MDVEQLQRIYLDGLASDTFKVLGPRRGEWDLSLDCDSPAPVVLFSRKTGLAKNLLREGYRPPMMEVTLLTPCRRCAPCLRRHSRLWAARARAETHEAERTWFSTFTFRPDVHIWMESAAAERKFNWLDLALRDQFAAVAQVAGMEITKYLKRIRKESGFSFRYLCVTEIHDGGNTSDFMRGRPHVHMLLHEFAGQPLRKEMLQRQWKHGFTDFKLVGDASKAAWYVSKYISKASEARTRASLGYGLR